MAPVRVQFQRQHGNADIPLPRAMSEHAAGLDICAAIALAVVLRPGDIATIPTGFAMALPAGYEAQIRPRSGLASRHGVTVVNAPGTIDSDYRGEVKVALINLGREAFTIERGMRIAQMVVMPVPRVEALEVAGLEETVRGTGGFGHTGTR